MTFDEFKEIRKKHNLLITFNDNIEAMSKEKYDCISKKKHKKASG